MTSSPVAAISSPSGAPGSPRVNLWERFSFAVIHAMVAALLACVSLAGLYRLGRVFGTLEWLTDYRRRRRFADALEGVLGRQPSAAQRRRITRRFFIRSRCDKLFYLIFDRIPQDLAPTLLTIENKSLLDEALAGGRGVYLALSHHGPHHVVGMLLALRGYKTVGVRDRHEGALRRFVQERFDERYPEFGQTRWLFTDSYPRDIYRCLQEGFVLGSAMDVRRVRSPNQKTDEVTIFGEKRSFSSGPMHIAIRCRAAVLQAFLISEPNFRYRFKIVDTLIDPDEVDDEAAAVARAIRTYAANVERYLRADPSQMSRI